MTASDGDQRLDHGIVGNGRVLALVARDSAIEWLCLPRFDSPAIFAALLDRDRGGQFRFLVEGRPITARAVGYVPNTNVLRSEFATDTAAWEVFDFAPRVLSASGHLDAPHELVRIVRPLAGVPRLVIDFQPRPDYGRNSGQQIVTAHGLEVLGAGAPCHLYTNVAGDRITQRLEVAVREPLYFSLVYGARSIPPTTSSLWRALDETIRAWRIWAMTCALPTFAPQQVLRSALSLKLHAYADTGAIIAAATTSIPEALGTERTWDYRYCWLRDAAFTVEALRRLSHLNEGAQFIAFLRDIAESGPLQPLYRIGGERHLGETTLDHLRGFNGNGPVRVGNAASEQQQNDLNGELVLCLQTMLEDPRIVIDQPEGFLPLIERLVEDAILRAPHADTGIWETRTLSRHYTFSRAMCWAAIARGAKIASRFGRRDLALRWSEVAQNEQRIVLERGFNTVSGCFTQALDGEHGDAANLLLPSLAIIDARDPRFVATLDDYERRMTRNGLMRRYTNADDFGATASAFTSCSFWWAEALALTGRLEAACAVFERVLQHANPLGLFSEDIDPATGRLLGNFPHASTHVGLINAAMTIAALMDARDGRVRAWT